MKSQLCSYESKKRQPPWVGAFLYDQVWVPNVLRSGLFDRRALFLQGTDTVTNLRKKAVQL